jgi:hypothetical protein
MTDEFTVLGHYCRLVPNTCVRNQGPGECFNCRNASNEVIGIGIRVVDAIQGDRESLPRCGGLIELSQALKLCNFRRYDRGGHMRPNAGVERRATPAAEP